ncbi:MAG: hypothetical protein P4L83_22675 [Nevskia sp.]|nr:hypothetical protein [Nevskia sp.]
MGIRHTRLSENLIAGRRSLLSEHVASDPNFLLGDGRLDGGPRADHLLRSSFEEVFTKAKEYLVIGSIAALSVLAIGEHVPAKLELAVPGIEMSVELEANQEETQMETSMKENVQSGARWPSGCDAQ